MDRALVAELVARLKRRMKLAISVTGRQLYVTVDDRVIEGAVERHAVV